MESIHIYEEKNYEFAVRDFKAAFFNVMSMAEENRKSYDEMIKTLQDGEEKERYKAFADKQLASSQFVIGLANELVKSVEELDVYSKTLKQLKEEKNVTLISSNQKVIEEVEEKNNEVVKEEKVDDVDVEKEEIKEDKVDVVKENHEVAEIEVDDVEKSDEEIVDVDDSNDIGTNDLEVDEPIIVNDMPAQSSNDNIEEQTALAEVTDLENVFANDNSVVEDDVVNESDDKMNDKKIYKSVSVDPVKAIIVLPKQFDKLKNAKSTQEALLNVRSSSITTDENSEDLESLSNKVSELYKSGNVEEAEALLEKISALNSKNEVDEEGNVLVKH